MAIELSPKQAAALARIAPIQDPAEFQNVHDSAKPEMARIVTEVMEANQRFEITRLECADLYLLIDYHEADLATVGYGPARYELFRNAIRLSATADAWLSDGKRTGAYRTRTVEQVIQASRPWRARLKAYGEQAFAFQPDIADQFADVNTSGTLDEEKDDLTTLTRLVEQHAPRLQEVGMKPEFVTQGKALLDEANGHGLLGILGLRSQQEAFALRDKIFTYVTLLAREARAAGINACFDDPEAKARFEAATFRNALRRIQPKRRGASGGGGAEEETTEPKAEGGAKGEEGKKPEAATPKAGEAAKPEAAKPEAAAAKTGEAAKPEAKAGDAAKAPEAAKPKEPA